MLQIKKNVPGGPENHDTIGMLAMDIRGNLSGACTTSDWLSKCMAEWVIPRSLAPAFRR